MTILGVLAMSCALSPTASSASAGRFVVRSLVPATAGRFELHAAVMRARRRLEQPECKRLFSEFKDASEQTLQANLEALGQTAASYLGLILFADGSARESCSAGLAYAFTAPGSRVVFVCGPQFMRASPTLAEEVVIHEALHSLGLGENPPSAREITAQVRERCGT
jgi:hypothetical protein